MMYVFVCNCDNGNANAIEMDHEPTMIEKRTLINTTCPDCNCGFVYVEKK